MVHVCCTLSSLELVLYAEQTCSIRVRATGNGNNLFFSSDLVNLKSAQTLPKFTGLGAWTAGGVRFGGGGPCLYELQV